MYVLEMTHGNG